MTLGGIPVYSGSRRKHKANRKRRVRKQPQHVYIAGVRADKVRVQKHRLS